MHMQSDREQGEYDDVVSDGAPARLHFDGVDTPIVTRITRQSERGMTVEQALPFLRLQTQVWGEAQRPSRIESVSVVVYDGTPRLVLDLAFDEQELAAVSQPLAVSAQQAPRQAHRGVVRPRQSASARIDETVPFDSPAPVAPKRERREDTQVFATQAARPLSPEVATMALSSMERELLQPKDWVYHVRLSWLRARPHLEHAGRASLALAKQGARRALPLLRRAWPLTQRFAAKVASFGRLAWQRAAARRSRSSHPMASASPTLPSQS